MYAKRRNMKKKSNNLLLIGLLAVGLLIGLFVVSQSTRLSTKASSSIQPVGQASGWNLVFSDEFEGTSLDSTKWVPCFSWGVTNGECSSTTTPEMTYRPDEVIIGNGIVRLRTQKKSTTINGKTYAYTSGMISSSKLYDQPFPYRFMSQYGYAEMRAKVPKGKGLWPAFWLLPPEGKWPPEIDVMENLTGGNNTTFQHHMNYHYNDENGVHQNYGGTWNSPVDLASDYHVYGMSWEAGRIRWFLDGVERIAPYTNTQYIPHEPMYLIANLQVGGSWPGSPDSSTPFPSYFDIDYIRYWQSDGAQPSPTPTTAGTNLLVNPGCESNTTSWSAWQGNLSRVTSGVRTGTGACKVNYASGVVYTIDDTPDTVNAPKQGDVYKATVWVKSDTSVGKDVYLNIRMTGGASPRAVFYQRGTLSSAWQQITLSAMVDQPDRNYLEFYVSQEGASSGDSMIVDDMTFSLTSSSSGGGSASPAPSPILTPTPSPSPSPVVTDTTLPVVTITNPVAGLVQKRTTVTLAASASDNVGVSSVMFYVNGSLKCTDTTVPYSCAWKVPRNSNTNYTIEAQAKDAAGNIGRNTISVYTN